MSGRQIFTVYASTVQFSLLYLCIIASKLNVLILKFVLKETAVSIMIAYKKIPLSLQMHYFLDRSRMLVLVRKDPVLPSTNQTCQFQRFLRSKDHGREANAREERQWSPQATKCFLLPYILFLYYYREKHGADGGVGDEERCASQLDAAAFESQIRDSEPEMEARKKRSLKLCTALKVKVEHSRPPSSPQSPRGISARHIVLGVQRCRVTGSGLV